MIWSWFGQFGDFFFFNSLLSLCSADCLQAVYTAEEILLNPKMEDLSCYCSMNNLSQSQALKD